MIPRSLTITAFFFIPLLLLASQETKENADFKLAVNLHNDKLYDLALEQFRQFVSTYPNTQQGMEARFYLGLSQLKLLKFDDARLSFQNFALAFSDHPKAPEAWWNVAEAYIAMNNAREAGLAFERLKTFHPKSKIAPQALLKASEYFEKGGDRENAKKALRNLVQDYASSDVILQARLKLGRMYFEENQFELARIEARKAADGSKEANAKAEALIAMSEALVRLGRLEEAQSSLNDVIKNFRSTPGYHAALFLLGTLQKESGSLDGAMNAWKIIAQDTVQASSEIRQGALIAIGDAYALSGDAAKALAHYEKAVRFDGARRGETLLKAGAMAEKVQAPAKASEFFKQALEDSSGSVNRRLAQLGGIRSFVASKNYAEAMKLVSTFRTQFPSVPEIPRILLEAARVCGEELNDHRRQVELLEVLMREYPSTSLIDDALFAHAGALRQAGSPELALLSYENLVQQFPASEHSTQARESIEAIKTYELKDKEGGLEKLALLIGDVIAGQPKGDLAFRLGEISFNDLKDFDRSADQFHSALQLGLKIEKQAAALYYQAKSNDYLHRKGPTADGAKQSPFARRAIALYDSLLKRFPISEFSEEATIAQLKLRFKLAGTILDARQINAAFLKDHSNIRRMDLIFFEAACAYQELKAFEDAVSIYRSILQNYRQSAAAPDALIRLSDALFALGENDTAAVVLQDFLTRYPNHSSSARAAWTLAQYYAERGNVSRAIPLYQTIEQKYFYTSFASDLDRARGDAYSRAGEPEKSVRSFKAYLSHLGNDVSESVETPRELLFKLAAGQEKAGNRSEAKRLYVAYLWRDTTTERAGQAYYALASIARAESMIALAAKYLERAGKFALGSTDQFNKASLEAAELFYGNEDYANALTRFSEVAQKAKGDSLQQYVQSRIIVCYFRLNNTKEGDARAASFVRTFPGVARYAAEFDYERGMYFLRSGDAAKAKAFFDNILQQYSTTALVPQAIYGNARLAELAGETQEALRLYASIVQRFPTDKIAPRAQLSLGNLHYNQEQWEAAARQYRALLDDEQRAPDLVQYAMNNLILAYKELSMFDGALELTRKYVERFPNDPELINKRIDIGVLFQKLGYYDQSVLHLQHLLESSDADLEGEIRYYIGEAHFYKGEYQQAILEFLKVPYLVVKKSKVDWTATSYYMAGQAYEKMSKFEQAITMYKQIIARPGIDATFKTGAQREIDRVTELVKSGR